MCLLVQDRRNFVRSPPTGVSFEWNFDEMLPIAKAILKEDPNLEKMRYELVPKVSYQIILSHRLVFLTVYKVIYN